MSNRLSPCEQIILDLEGKLKREHEKLSDAVATAGVLVREVMMYRELIRDVLPYVRRGNAGEELVDRVKKAVAG